MSPHETQYVVLHQYRLNQDVVSVMVFDVLFQNFSTPSRPLPSRVDKISRKSEFSDPLLIVGFTRKPDVCSKLASPQAPANYNPKGSSPSKSPPPSTKDSTHPPIREEYQKYGLARELH